MSWEQYAEKWSAHFVAKLQDVYEIPEEEAREKVEAWLDSVKVQDED